MLRIRPVSLLALVLAMILAGCAKGAQVSMPLPTSTPGAPAAGATSSAAHTATPARVPISSGSTPTPLFRAAEIFSGDHCQNLTLFVGDVFVLHRFEHDEEPLDIHNPNVLRATTDPFGDVVTLKAIGLGETAVSSALTFPCPPGPVCELPLDYIYVIVNVVDH